MRTLLFILAIVACAALESPADYSWVPCPSGRSIQSAPLSRVRSIDDSRLEAAGNTSAVGTGGHRV